MNDDVSVRLSELEKQFRRLTRRFTGVLTAVVVVVAWLMLWAFWHGFPAPQRVTSDSFSADDYVSVWPEVIMAERAEGGTVGFLTAHDKHTRLRLSEILWTEEAPSRSFTGRPRVLLLADDEQTGLLLYDRNGQERAKLVVSEDEPKLVLLDKNGDAVFSAP